MPLRLLLGGGGTGGHIFMAIALAQEWKSRQEGNEVLFVGARGRLEEQLMGPTGIPMVLLEISQLKGVSSLKLLKSLMKLPACLLRCMRLTRSFQPHVAIGVGGFASGPVILAAALQRTPTLIVEPNAKPGITNRWLSRTARVVAVAFPEAQRTFGPKTRLTGIPVRKEFFLPSAPGPKPFTLLIFGGSQGSRALNAVAAQAIPRLKEEIPELRVVLQTGSAEFPLYCGHQSEWCQVRPFIDDMPAAMARASVVVCRAGASTIAELAASGKCAVLVPFPFASDDHQTGNARVLSKRGAARLQPQSELTADKLIGHVVDLYRDPEQRCRMESAIRQFSNPGSAGMIVDLALSLIDGSAA
ncbi:MAG: undecaprenyldiphospho-muramoylpentapeptide beta-N-acetylglucosaminyltransferase [Acidobacteria bacterium]|nr:undecaprenyldiphospho-muramoylpentapeptide beta-N-acetylglucosaminyltransferase [Acidobacteriota bacterium]